jgi:hypothetical protein
MELLALYRRFLPAVWNAHRHWPCPLTVIAVWQGYLSLWQQADPKGFITATLVAAGEYRESSHHAVRAQGTVTVGRRRERIRDEPSWLTQISCRPPRSPPPRPSIFAFLQHLVMFQFIMPPGIEMCFVSDFTIQLHSILHHCYSYCFASLPPSP